MTDEDIEFAPDLPRGVAQGRLLVRRLADVQSRSVRFVVPGLIPLRTLTLLAGVGGLGKSTWAAGVAARETRGEYGGEPHDVIYISYEDTAEEVWRPRVLAANGDPERVIEVRVPLTEGGVVVLPTDLDDLAAVITECSVRLVVIDPIIAAVDLSLDTHKDQHVRSVLGRLCQVAEDTDCAFLGIGHLNKNPSTEAYVRIANSVAFWNASRSVILVTKEEDDEEHRLVSQVKGNWSAGNGVQRWRLEGILLPDEIDAETGRSVETSRLTYVGEAEGVFASDVLQRKDGDKVTDAALFLLQQLRDGDWRESAAVKAAAANTGIASRTLQRAREELGVEHETRDFPAKTWWRLPDGRATPAPTTVAQPDEAASEAGLRPVEGTVVPALSGGTVVAQPRPLIGDPEYLPWLFERFEAGLLTEGEWHLAEKAHRFVVTGGGVASP